MQTTQISTYTLTKVVSGDRIEWRRDGVIHSHEDQPAVVTSRGTKKWYRNGLLHRDGDRPAVKYTDGEKRWLQNGVIHRLSDGPSVIDAEGTLYWYQHGKLHRDGDLPAIIYTSGSEHWYREGKLFRENGPAVIIRELDSEDATDEATAQASMPVQVIPTVEVAVPVAMGLSVLVDVPRVRAFTDAFRVETNRLVAYITRSVDFSDRKFAPMLHIEIAGQNQYRTDNFDMTAHDFFGLSGATLNIYPTMDGFKLVTRHEGVRIDLSPFNQWPRIR